MENSRIPARLIAIAIIASIATVVLATWPAALHLSTHVIDGGKITHVKHAWSAGQLAADVVQTVWIVNWNLHALVTQPLHIFDANILYPTAMPLARAEHMFGTSLLGIPGALVGGPVFVHQTTLLLCGILNFLAAAYVVMRWTDSSLGALVAGVIYAFSAYNVGGLYHLQSLSVSFFPILIFGAERFGATGERRFAVLGASALALQMLSGQYLAMWALMAWCVACGVAVATGRPGVPRATQLRHDLGWLFLVSLGAGLVVLPMQIPYLIFAFTNELPEHSSTRYNMLFRLTAYYKRLGYNPQVYVAPLLWPLAGMGIAALAMRGRRGRSQLAMVLMIGIIGALITLGPRAERWTVYDFFSAIVPGFKTLREPVRAAVLPHLAIALLGGCGISLIAKHWPKLAAVVVVCVLAGFVMQQGAFPVPLKQLANRDQLPPAYEFLAQCGAGDPLLELPVAPEIMIMLETNKMYLSTFHWLPLLNGRASYWPPETREIISLAEQVPKRSAIEKLREMTGVRWLRLDCRNPERPLSPALRRLCTGRALPGALTYDYGTVKLIDLGPVDELPRKWPRRWDPSSQCEELKPGPIGTRNMRRAGR